MRSLKNKQEIHNVVTTTGETNADDYETLDKFVDYFREYYTENQNLYFAVKKSKKCI